MTAVGITMKKYCVSAGDTKSMDMLFIMPFNFREPPKDPTRFEFSNQIAAFPVALPLVTDFKLGIKAIK